MHPLNLGFRFLLELSALVSFGMWGWKQSDSWWRFVLAIGIPLALAAVWGIFAVPDDPSRSGAAHVITPGIVRLIIELAFFAFAAWCFRDLEYHRVSLMFSILVITHYLISYDRIAWLFAH